MAQWIRSLAAQLDDLSSVSGIHMLKREDKAPRSYPLTSPDSPHLSHTINQQIKR